MRSSTCLLVALAGLGPHLATGENWFQWRGPHGNGTSPTANPPAEWSEEKNILWKRPIEGEGSSTPILWGDRIFLLSARDTGKVDPSLPRPEEQPERKFGIRHPNTEYEFIVLCLDAEDGEVLWRHSVNRRVPPEGHHGDNNFASASPATDGERLYSWFGSAGLYCHDLEGSLLWKRDLGDASMGASLGEGSSPALYGDRVVLVRDHQGPSYILALDKRSGETLWGRLREEDNSWATPCIVTRNGTTSVVVPGTRSVISYDLEDGKILWKQQGLTDNPIPSPVADDANVYCMTGYRGHSLLALSLSAKIPGSIQWSKDRGTPYTPSPLLSDGLLFFNQSHQPLWSCLRASDGEVLVDRERLPGLNTIYSSPVASRDHIFVTDRGGATLALERSPAFRVVATSRLEDTFHASMALQGDRIYLRGRRFLYSIGRRKQEGLSREQAEAAIQELWKVRSRQLLEEREAEIEGRSITLEGHTLRYLERTFGEAPAKGRSLWISLHGGGGTPAPVNDGQWRNQIRLYQPAEGIYVAPRAPTDTWNLWHRNHVDPLFDRLVENYVIRGLVDPDRVYLMGYSAGGDGVYQLAPRMADRWAAASMMAGHPNDARPENLRNLPFAIFVGAEDSAYSRNQKAAEWQDMLQSLQEADPSGYVHLVRIYPGTGHWMKLQDAESLPWMAAHVRNPWPSTLVWNQNKGITSRFYWLQIPEDHLDRRQAIRAQVDGQSIHIAASDTPALFLRLSDRLLDLDQPVTVTVNGRERYQGMAVRTLGEIEDSLEERADPASASTARIHLQDL